MAFRSLGVLAGILYLCTWPAPCADGSQWETGYQERLRRLVGATTWEIGQGILDLDAGKRDWPALLAELWKARGDAARPGRGTPVRVNIPDAVWRGATLSASARWRHSR